MCRLIWAFAGRTYHIVGNLMSRLIFYQLFACWVFLHALVVVCWLLKLTLSKSSFRNTIRKSNGLRSRSGPTFYRSRSGSNCLRRLSADNKSCCQDEKSYIIYLISLIILITFSCHVWNFHLICSYILYFSSAFQTIAVGLFFVSC